MFVDAPHDVVRCVALHLQARPRDLVSLSACNRDLHGALGERAKVLCALRLLRLHALVARFRADCRAAAGTARLDVADLELLFRLWWGHRRAPRGCRAGTEDVRNVRREVLRGVRR